MRRVYKPDDSDVDSEAVMYLDAYEQDLMDLRQLVNNKKTSRNQIPYDLAIEKMVEEIQISGHDANMSKNHINNDIELAFKGGKYRSVNPPQLDSDSIIEIRKKRCNKPKPKRKVVKKCRCK